MVLVKSPIADFVLWVQEAATEPPWYWIPCKTGLHQASVCRWIRRNYMLSILRNLSFAFDPRLSKCALRSDHNPFYGSNLQNSYRGRYFSANSSSFVCRFWLNVIDTCSVLDPKGIYCFAFPGRRMEGEWASTTEAELQNLASPGSEVTKLSVII